MAMATRGGCDQRTSLVLEEQKALMAEREMQLHKKFDVPNDVVVEILSRVPVNSLLRLRWVCKYWFDLITRDDDFIKMHLHHSNPLVLISGYKTLYSWKYWDMFDTSSLSPLTAFMVCKNHPFSDDFEILGSCNGLIYLCSRNEYFLWNPSTTEFKKLPGYEQPYMEFKYRECSPTVLHGFGYDHSTDDYKVMEIKHFRLYNDNASPITSAIGIYTLGSNSWSTKFETNPLMKAHHHMYTIYRRSGVLVNGALHWMMKSWLQTPEISCFDVVKENHREIQLPAINSAMQITLEVLNRCLCIFLVNFDYTNAELWMMKDYGVNESWTKLFTIDVNSLVKEISRSQGNVGSFTHTHLELLNYSQCEDDRILILCGLNRLITYYPKNDTATIENICKEHENIVRGCYIESLVSVKSGMYMTAAGSTTTCILQVQEREDVNSESLDWMILDILARLFGSFLVVSVLNVFNRK